MDLNEAKKPEEEVTPLCVIHCPRPRSRFCFYFLVFLAIILLFRTNPASKHGYAQTRAQLNSTPSKTEWKTYSKCLNDITCDSCKVPIVSFLQPPIKQTVLLSSYGTGGSYLRDVTKTMMRLITGMDDNCYLHLLNDCIGSEYHYAHFIYTRYITVSSLVASNYKPTQIIHLTRNPFDAIIAAYHYYTQCVKGHWYTKLICFGLKTDINKGDVDFDRFALAYSLEYELQNKYVSTFNNSLVIYYEDLISEHPKQALNDVFTFIQNENTFSAERALQCSVRPSPYHFDKADVFSPELIKRICPHLLKYWNQEKFGPTLCHL